MMRPSKRNVQRAIRRGDAIRIAPGATVRQREQRAMSANGRASAPGAIHASWGDPATGTPWFIAGLSGFTADEVDNNRWTF